MLQVQSECGLAFPNRLAEDIGVDAIVIAKLKFSDVQRQIFGAYFMEGADHAALEDRPEAFDRVCVDRPHNVLPRCMSNNVVRVFGIKTAIAYPLVCDQQTHLFGHRASDEGPKNVAADGFDDPSHNFTLALEGSHNWGLARTHPSPGRRVDPDGGSSSCLRQRFRRPRRCP